MIFDFIQSFFPLKLAKIRIIWCFYLSLVGERYKSDVVLFYFVVFMLSFFIFAHVFVCVFFFSLYSLDYLFIDEIVGMASLELFLEDTWIQNLFGLRRGRERRQANKKETDKIKIRDDRVSDLRWIWIKLLNWPQNICRVIIDYKKIIIIELVFATKNSAE